MACENPKGVIKRFCYPYIAGLQSEAINRVRTLDTVARMTTRAHNGYVRAERHHIDAALWSATYTSVAHI
ncbi:MAG: hypothetical protein K2N12_01875 [Helicobacter sp.]|nr:hypothetical protein [Helicobacter sp.]